MEKEARKFPSFESYISDFDPESSTGKSPIEMYLDIVSDAHTQEELAQAFNWVLRVFENMIRKKEERKQIYFVEITSTERTRQMGLTTAADGWEEIISLNARWMSLFYIEVILDDSYKTDQEKVRAMIAFSKSHPDATGNQLHEKAWKWIDGPEIFLLTQYVQ